MRRILVMFCMCLSTQLCAQQLDVLRFNYENRFLYNPSALLDYTTNRISAQHQQTFTGIENAPSLSIMSFQLPILNNDMGVGFGVTTQALGIVRDSRVNAAFAYKLRLTRLNSSYVSLGLGVELNQFRIASDRITASVDLRDPHLSASPVTGIKTNLSMGAMYASSEEFERGVKSIYKVGIGVHKILAGRKQIDDFQYNIENIFSIFGSYEFLLYDGSIISLMNDTQLHGLSAVTSTFGARGYFSKTLILGLSFDTNQYAGLEIGMDLDQSIAPLNGNLRVIASGGIPLGQTGSDLGMGYGLKVVYNY